MVTVVVVVNILISLTLLYVAWRLWKIKRSLARAANILVAAERSTQKVLVKAPDFIYIGKRNIRKLRQSNQSIGLRTQQLQQILGLLVLASQWWQRFQGRPGVGNIARERGKGQEI
jgi:hypothetical protein